ncbi:hypothetical protein NPIL_381521 [Nephila pilipes]|uniref:Uncharacterized protein n=1 Tax=Nephila pilipes TaxID=299642 RepID=A0A8X6QAA0_NEPPI|nr:hypothetical protein NPIL_381521 [Nephila pilipes]
MSLGVWLALRALPNPNTLREFAFCRPPSGGRDFLSLIMLILLILERHYIPAEDQEEKKKWERFRIKKFVERLS